MLRIEEAHLPKHKILSKDVPVRSNALLQDEFHQIGYISIASCDGKGFRIPLHETVHFISCVTNHGRGNGASHAHSTRLVLGPVDPVGSVWSL